MELCWRNKNSNVPLPLPPPLLLLSLHWANFLRWIEAKESDLFSFLSFILSCLVFLFFYSFEKFLHHHIDYCPLTGRVSENERHKKRHKKTRRKNKKRESKRKSARMYERWWGSISNKRAPNKKWMSDMDVWTERESESSCGASEWVRQSTEIKWRRRNGTKKFTNWNIAVIRSEILHKWRK